MRQWFVVGLMLLTSLTVKAGSSDSFTFNGAERFKELLLQADVYRTEYRTEQRPSTCYRQEQHGYRTECHYETRQNCTYIPRTCHTVTRQVCTSAPPVCRPVCHQGPQGQICRQVCSNGGTTCRPVYEQVCSGGYNSCTPYQYQVCRDVPVYVSVPYACVETVQIPYQVLDHHVDAKVALNLAELPQGAQANEKFTVAIQNDDVVLTAATSKKVLIYATKSQNVSVNGTTKYLDTKFDLQFLDLVDLREALTGISQVEVQDNILTFAIGKESAVEFKHRLKIEQKKMFKDKVLIDRALNSYEVVPFTQGGQQFFSIDLKKLDVKLKNKKYEITLSTEAVIGNSSRPLNHQDLPQLKLVKEVDIKL